MKQNTLKKDELLSLRKIIEEIFEKKTSIYNSPFRVLYLSKPLPSSKPVQVLFTVPKRNFKHAVDRNRIRRRIKEAYRKHKHELYQYLNENNQQLAIVIIYIYKKELSYSEIEKKLILSLQKIQTNLNSEK